MIIADIMAVRLAVPSRAGMCTLHTLPRGWFKAHGCILALVPFVLYAYCGRVYALALVRRSPLSACHGAQVNWGSAAEACCSCRRSIEAGQRKRLDGKKKDSLKKSARRNKNWD